MTACAGITRAGERCTLPAQGPSGMCWLHDPARADQRHRHASKAARSKGNREVADLKNEIRTVIADVRAGELAGWSSTTRNSGNSTRQPRY